MALFKKLFIILFIFNGIGFDAQAETQTKILQILHTNDLHSYWEHASNKTMGGYARVKTALDQMEAEGIANGWTTIRLDAGDFSEGSINFWADQGQISFEVMKLMNYDVIALGNHDHQLGLAELIRHASVPGTNLPLVAANFFTDQPASIKPGRFIRRNGLVIAVGGATTDNPTYTWTARPAQITSPLEPLETWLAYDETPDIRIALTHLGVHKEQKLARASTNIDLIVGGHSHTTLDTPIYELNKNGKPVPIVQAGARGLYVGRILMEMPVRQYAHILSYSLKRITPEIPEDPIVKQKVAQGMSILQKTFSGYNFNHVLGNSDKNYFSHREPVPVIGNFLADAIREAAGTEIAFDSGKLYGERLAEGPVTLYDILNLAPHLYTWPSQGWQIVTCNITGGKLSKVLTVPALFKQALMVSGMTFHMNAINLVSEMVINGEPVQKERVYSFALSEGFVRGLQSYPELDRLCRPYTSTGILVREAVVKKALTMKSFTEKDFGPRRISGFKPDDWPCIDDCPDDTKGGS